MPLEDGDNSEEAGLGDPELIRGGGTYILPRGIIRNDTFSFLRTNSKYAAATAASAVQTTTTTTSTTTLVMNSRGHEKHFSPWPVL